MVCSCRLHQRGVLFDDQMERNIDHSRDEFLLAHTQGRRIKLGSRSASGSEKHFPVVMSEFSDIGFLERSALTADRERLEIDLYQIARTSDLLPRRLGTSQVSLNRIDLFGGRPTNSPPRLELNLMTRCGSGSAVGDAIFIPYAAHTDLVTVNSVGKVQTFMGNNYSAEVGVLSSTNAGRSWDRTKVFGYESYQPVIRSTKANTLLFADEKSRLLRSSTRSDVTGNWSSPEMVTVTVAMGGGYIAESSADTVHVCWLDDRRKNGLGFFVYGDFAGSYRNKQVFYRQKKDGDTAWSKEKLLSSGLSYVGSITMSAEGSKIVIAWQNREGREVYPKASIYFITSKDNGRTWSKYRRVTGIEESSAENPRVSLLRDTIHLFYNQAGTVVYRQCSFPTD